MSEDYAIGDMDADSPAAKESTWDRWERYKREAWDNWANWKGLGE